MRVNTLKTPAQLARFAPAVAAAALVALMPNPGPAPVAQSNENARYAAVVVDAASGEVLFARHADARRYPASVTKVMTLYLAFEALSEGKVKLDDVITVSPRAASQPPSKLGLAAGQTITLDNAMRATAVRSANDMAMAIAEHIGGSEARFAAMATLKAEELGMTQTRYVNPHGLPDGRQLTTARDLAVLARAVMRDYPQYYRYFGLHDWAYNGRDYRNTNGLLNMAGYDGIKTGFTNASGYNLAASKVENGKRLITIVLGGRSSASRNAHVAELMNTGFEVERRRERGERLQVAQAFFEQRGFGIGSNPDNAAPIAYASLQRDEDEDGPAPASAAPIGAGVALVAGPPPANLPTRVAPPPSARPVERAEARAPRTPEGLTASLNGGPVAARDSLNRQTASRAAATPAGGWAVQVGAFKDQKVANDWLTEVARRFRTQFNGADRDVQTAGEWYRSRFVGLSQEAAESACAALSERRVTCMVIRPA